MNEIIGMLVKQLGVQESQATGGMGLLLKLAQDKLGGDFSKVSEVVPDAGALIGQAPKPKGAASLLGGLAAAVGGDKAAGLASLAAGFSQLKLDPAMVGKFAQVLMGFVKSKGGEGAASLLTQALK